MKVALTGATGQLGRSLIEKAAVRSGFEIVALGRAEVDLEQPGSAAEAIARLKPDVVVNAAAYTAVDQAEVEPDRAFRVNAEAPGEMASAAREIAASLIHISTDYVFDGRAEAPYREDSATNPQNVYGRSKLAGEEQVREANPNHLIVRTAWVYSPFGRNFVKTMMDAARTRESLSVVADQVGSPTSALDLADALLALLEVWGAKPERGLGETYHVAGSGQTSWCGLAQAIMAECAALGVPTADVIGISTADWPTKAVRPRNSVLDCEKFERDFGIRMPDWQLSVAETVRRLAARQ